MALCTKGEWDDEAEHFYVTARHAIAKQEVREEDSTDGSLETIIELWAVYENIAQLRPVQSIEADVAFEQEEGESEVEGHPEESNRETGEDTDEKTGEDACKHAPKSAPKRD